MDYEIAFGSFNVSTMFNASCEPRVGPTFGRPIRDLILAWTQFIPFNEMSAFTLPVKVGMLEGAICCP